MTIRGLIVLGIGVVLVGIVSCTVLGFLFLPKLLNPQVLYTCADGHTQNVPCTSGDSTQSASSPSTPQTGSQQTPQPSDNGQPAFVSTSGQPCPTRDFSLQQGIGSCNFPGGKTLICEGDLNDSLGVHHDSNANTGQVDIIDKPATIDGTSNGGTCHYSPPWTLDQSINSVKGGCGNGCSSVLVYHDGSLEKTV